MSYCPELNDKLVGRVVESDFCNARETATVEYYAIGNKIKNALLEDLRPGAVVEYLGKRWGVQDGLALTTTHRKPHKPRVFKIVVEISRYL